MLIHSRSYADEYIASQLSQEDNYDIIDEWFKIRASIATNLICQRALHLDTKELLSIAEIRK